MAKQSVGFGNHYQAVIKTTGLNKITKEIFTKRGLISCLDYYMKLNRGVPNGTLRCERGYKLALLVICIKIEKLANKNYFNIINNKKL